MRPSRFFALDILRTLAALCVVVFHYAFFAYDPSTNTLSEAALADLPFRSELALLYDHGGTAVEFFFLLSGFIFFINYHASIARGSVDGWSFFVLRFSRLYPLHLLTLLVVALLQGIFISIHSHFFMFQFNDAYHFALNLGLVSSWGFQSGLSFNGPVWSLSIEALLYLSFFLVSTSRLAPALGAGALVIVGAALFRLAGPELATIGRGVFCFYCGGMVAILAAEAERRNLLGRAALLLASTFCGASAVCAAFLDGGKLFLVLFGATIPSAIFCVVIVQFLRPGLFRRLSRLGDWSYSIYLWHFPLILLLFLAGAAENARQPWFLAVFIVVLCLLANLSFRWFELPLQRYLRGRLLSPRADRPRSA